MGIAEYIRGKMDDRQRRKKWAPALDRVERRERLSMAKKERAAAKERLQTEQLISKASSDNQQAKTMKKGRSISGKVFSGMKKLKAKKSSFTGGSSGSVFGSGTSQTSPLFGGSNSTTSILGGGTPKIEEKKPKTTTIIIKG